MSQLPPAPEPYGPPGWTAGQEAPRWTADSKAARLTIPYLGPVPSPARPLSFAFMAGCAVAAVVQLVKAVLNFQQASLDQRFVNSPGRALADQVLASEHTLKTIGSVSLWVTIGVLVLDLLWRSRRRPKAVRNERGEAYVEFPVMWVTPVILRVSWAVTALAAIAFSVAGRSTKLTKITEFPHLRQMRGVSSLCFAGFWLLLIVWLVIVQQSHDRRVAWSAPYRADPASVPFFPPVAGIGLFSGGPPRPDSRATASGPGWFFSTAGLILLVFVAIPAVIGGVAELGYGHATGLLWLLGGVAGLAFVGWVMVRRYQQGKL